MMMMLGPLLLLNKYIMSLISLHNNNNNKENSYCDKYNLNRLKSLT